MTFQTHHGSGASVARLPSRLDLEAEYALIYELRERASARLAELEVPLRTALGLAQPLIAAHDSLTLPRSGLVQAQPGVLLFKGGRADA